jgi:uncharacterized protein (TIGR02444 family)
MNRDTPAHDKAQTMSCRALRKAEDGGAAFWRFSLALYARPGVAGALIALQDRAGLDVNLILFGLWAGARHGIRLDSGGFAMAAEAVTELGGLVRNIRALRRQFSGVSDGDMSRLHRALLRLELAAERQVQRRLAQCFATGVLPHALSDRHSAVQANLSRCLGGESASPEAAVLARELAVLTRRP